MPLQALPNMPDVKKDARPCRTWSGPRRGIGGAAPWRSGRRRVSPRTFIACGGRRGAYLSPARCLGGTAAAISDGRVGHRASTAIEPRPARPSSQGQHGYRAVPGRRSHRVTASTAIEPSSPSAPPACGAPGALRASPPRSERPLAPPRSRPHPSPRGESERPLAAAPPRRRAPLPRGGDEWPRGVRHGLRDPRQVPIRIAARGTDMRGTDGMRERGQGGCSKSRGSQVPCHDLGSSQVPGSPQVPCHLGSSQVPCSGEFPSSGESPSSVNLGRSQVPCHDLRRRRIARFAAAAAARNAPSCPPHPPPSAAAAPRM